jgi:REP element-mobilizing transposase RayT
MSGEADTAFFKLHTHLVFVAKYRHRAFEAQAIDVLRAIFTDVCSDARATLVEMDGETTTCTCSWNILPKWLSRRS